MAEEREYKLMDFRDSVPNPGLFRGNDPEFNNFMVGYNTPTVALGPKCKGELMRHQSSMIWILNELEKSDELRFPKMPTAALPTAYGAGNKNYDARNFKTNRYKVKMPMGSGKTKMMIGHIINSPRPKVRPIYWIDTQLSTPILQERVFVESAIIWPTVIITRSSIYAQWLGEIAEFSTLRVFPVGDSRALIQLVEMATNSLATLNASYDIILLDYKTVSGKMDNVTNGCAALFEINTKKQKHLVPMVMNALSRRCFARIVYDDSEFHIKAAIFENAMNCIYLSATHFYGNLRGASHHSLRDTDPKSFENILEFPSYTFDNSVFNQMVTINIDPAFLKASISLGIPDAVVAITDASAGAGVSQENGENPENASVKISITEMRNMMPSEPEVWLCPVVNEESKVIDVIGCLCNDAKIMESVNSLAKTSFAEVIKSLMAGRYEVYKTATKIVAHYSAIDHEALLALPRPPEGLSFTLNDLRKCEPIVYAWRDLSNRIRDLVADEQKIIDNERKVLERVKHHLEDAECAICLDALKDGASGIMLCCNKILHIRCILMCSARRCAFCRTPYGATSKETFAPMHHDTDWSAFSDAANASLGMEAIMKSANLNSPERKELTKMSVLQDIVCGRFAQVKREQIRLIKRGSIVYDSAIEAKCESLPERMKILVYCSADDTLKKIEAEMPIQHSHLTPSAAATFKKIQQFRNSTVATAILANSWKDAAGIDFKTATDVVIINYVDASEVVQQMVARLQRMGRTTRARIWLIAYNNECDRWLSTHCQKLVA